MVNKAIFFDKDGVLNVDKGILKEPLEILDADIYPYTAGVLSFFRRKGFKIIVITNQTVIARGIVTETELAEGLKLFRQRLIESDEEAVIDKIFYCPHHPEADVPEYRINCECRKPKPGMLLEAAVEFDIDLKKSFMIGDRISDIIAGRLAGCTTIQCLSGRHSEKMIKSDLKLESKVEPDYVINNITELKEIII